MTHDPDVLTLKEAAAFLRVGMSTVYTSAKAGKIPAGKILGQWRFSRAALLEHLSGQARKRIRTAAVVLALCSLTVPAQAEPLKGYATYFTVDSCKREGNSGITASGLPLRDSSYVCALPHRRFGESYRICRADDPTRCVVALHTDLGPGKMPRQRGVVIDLSRGAFLQLASVREGKISVTVERLQ